MKKAWVLLLVLLVITGCQSQEKEPKEETVEEENATTCRIEQGSDVYEQKLVTDDEGTITKMIIIARQSMENIEQSEEELKESFAAFEKSVADEYGEHVSATMAVEDGNLISTYTYDIAGMKESGEDVSDYDIYGVDGTVEEITASLKEQGFTCE